MSSEQLGMYYRKDNSRDEPQPYRKKRNKTPGESSRWSPTRDSGQSGQSSGAMSGRDNAGTSGKPDLSHLTPAAKEAYEDHVKQLTSLNEQKASLGKILSTKQTAFRDAKHSQRLDKPRLQNEIADKARKLKEVEDSIRGIQDTLKALLKK